MGKESPDPKLVVVTFRVTPGERRKLDQMRGTSSITDFIRKRIFGGAQ